MNYEEKAKRYDEAIKRASNLYEDAVEMENDMTTKTCEIIFPELAESEDKDERIRRVIIEFLQAQNVLYDKINVEFTMKEAIAWLVKQGDYDRLIEEMKKRKELLSKEKEKATSTNDKLSLGGRIAMLQELLAFNICNTTDNDEPKFKVGDWIVNGEGKYYQIKSIYNVDGGYYIATDKDGEDNRICFNIANECFHLWTIADAKDGDVLVDVYGNICIFDKCYDFDWMSCCSLGNNGGFQYFTVEHENEKTYPATKEQRDLLFEKMAQAGWKWNSEEKELKKIEDKTLDADKVIEWLKTKVYDDSTYGRAMIEQFKKDFLC